MRKRAIGAVLAAAAILALGAAPASAEIIVPSGTLTEPGGVVRTPGPGGTTKLWVADGLNGICEVRDGAFVASDFCAPETHAPGVEPPPGPTAPEPSDLAYDAVSNTLWATEGTSGSSGVWKLEFAADFTIASAQKIVDTTGADDRIFGLDLTRVGGRLEIDYVSKRSQLVQRITDALGPSPVPSAVGIAKDEEVEDVARLNGKLYLAEATGVTVVDDPGGPVRDARSVPELAGHIAGSLAADQDAGRLYVGTNNGNGADQIIAFEPAATPGAGRAEGYAGGMSGIGALALDVDPDPSVPNDRAVLAADDPAVASGAVGAVGGGRVMRFAFVPLGRPRVLLDTVPPVNGPATEVTFTFHSTVDRATIECALDAGAWVPCDAGTVTYSALADGAHEARFRATSAAGTGAVMSYVFVVDTAAPTVTIDNPEAERDVVGERLDVRFSASEGGVSFDCSVDGAAPVACSSPLRLRGLAFGEHEIVVSATDLVGHTSRPVRWTFSTRPVPPPPPAPDPAPSVDGTSGSEGTGEDRSGRPGIIRPFTTASSSISCRSAVTRRLNMRRPPAVIRMAFRSGYRPGYVRMVITKAGKRKQRVKVLSMHRVLESSKPCSKVSWGLWRSEGRKLRTGRYTLTVMAGKSRHTLRRFWSGTLRVLR